MSDTETETERFEVQPLPKVGLIDRLFRRVPRETALVEIRNILATKPLAAIEAGAIIEPLQRNKLNPRNATKDLRAIFEQAASFAVSDNMLGDAERQGLRTLQDAFQLTDDEANTVLEAVTGRAFEQVVREAVSRDAFTDQDRERIEATAKALGISEERSRQCFKSAATEVVQGAFTRAIADRRYTKNEEVQITTLAKALGVSIKYDETTERLVEKFRTLAQVDEGTLPSVAVSILLKRGEVCHFAGAATHQRIKTVARRINYSGPTASIRITRGLRWRLGSIAVQSVPTEAMVLVDTGQFYITSNRVLFDGAKKNTSIPLSKITNFTVYRDALEIEKDSGPHEYFMGNCDWEVAGACLDAVAKKARGLG